MFKNIAKILFGLLLLAFSIPLLLMIGIGLGDAGTTHGLTAFFGLMVPLVVIVPGLRLIFGAFSNGEDLSMFIAEGVGIYILTFALQFIAAEYLPPDVEGWKSALFILVYLLPMILIGGLIVQAILYVAKKKTA
jgi:hypothetical protein